MNKNCWQIRGNLNIPIQIKYFSSLGSTNDKAKQMAIENAPEWTVIWAGQQTAGRGRFERKWYSPANLGLYFSIILRPQIDLHLLNMLNFRTALVIRTILQSRLMEASIERSLPLMLKWPNDVLVKGKKIAGILLESEIVEQRLNFLILGVGINLNQQRQDFPVEVKQAATSLKLLTKRDWDSSQFLEDVLLMLQQNFISDQQSDFENVLVEYEKYLAFKGQSVEVKLQNQEVRGRLMGIDSDGYLLLKQGKNIKTVTTGDLWMS